MFVSFPPALLRSAFGVLIAIALICPAGWSEGVPSAPRTIAARWQIHASAPITGLDLGWDGQTVALTTASSTPDQDSHLQLYDVRGRETLTIGRRAKILGVSLANDGKYAAIGMLDFSVALFSSQGELLWERRSIGLPALTPHAARVVTVNGGGGGPVQPLVEVFLRHGEKSWEMRRRGRVWRWLISDQGDLLLGLWNGEVLFLDRHYHLAWQQMLPKEVMALAISPEDARYVAVASGVLDQELVLYERTGRLRWRRKIPLAITELSLARRGEFLLTYGNTIHGQHVALYRGDGERQWAYHLAEPAAESSKAIIVPQAPLIVAGIAQGERFFLQGFALSGEILWLAPVPEPIFDFRVSRDGRYIAAATENDLFFFDVRSAESSKAEFLP
jgi:hypothetical protein